MTRKRPDENFGDVGQRSRSLVGNLVEAVVGHFLRYFSTNFRETWLVYRHFFVHLANGFSGPYTKSQSQSDKNSSCTIKFTLHISCHRDNKPRHVQSKSKDILTNNSVDGPSQVTIQGDVGFPTSSILN